MLDSFLTAYFKDKELEHIFTDVLGTNDPSVVWPLIEAYTNQYLRSSIDKIIFIQSSIGVVFGFLLKNNNKVTLKIYSPKLSKSYLDEMNRIQKVFHDEDFPAPNVLSTIFSFNNAYAGFYQLIDGQSVDAHQPQIRLELAKYLAEFFKISTKHNFQPLENFFQQANRERLWPVPHNVLFDLEKTAAGAEWIAEKAVQAKRILLTDSQEKKLAHTDWGVKNAIFHANKLIGIFDWDSLGSMTESEMVGRAAAQFTADWESGLKVTPTPEEGRLFITAYENCRGKKFSEEEYQIISASADYLIAIISRFEHAGTDPSVHPYQDLLKRCGNKSFLFSD